MLAAVKHLDGPELLGERFGDLAGAVRRGVVDDQDPVLAGHEPLELGSGRAHDPLDVLGLVVGRESRPRPARPWRESSGGNGHRADPALAVDDAPPAEAAS